MRRLLIALTAVTLAACSSSPTSPRDVPCSLQDVALNGVVVGQILVCPESR